MWPIKPYLIVAWIVQLILRGASTRLTSLQLTKIFGVRTMQADSADTTYCYCSFVFVSSQSMIVIFRRYISGAGNFTILVISQTSRQRKHRNSGRFVKRHLLNAVLAVKGWQSICIWHCLQAKTTQLHRDRCIQGCLLRSLCQTPIHLTVSRALKL